MGHYNLGRQHFLEKRDYIASILQHPCRVPQLLIPESGLHDSTYSILLSYVGKNR